MTASHALRIGSEKFATELAQLTGGRQGIGPSASRFLKNTSVEVDDIDHNKSAGSRTPPKRYPGKIVKVQSNGQFTVEYTDGKVEEDVDKARIHPLGVEATVGGVLFLDEAYDLDPKSNDTGRSILAEIMSVAEDHRDKVTIILAGYRDDIETKLFGFNVGMASRFDVLTFDDFTPHQLEEIWNGHCTEQKWKCNDNVTQIVVRRLQRRIGKKGFGNARTVREIFNGAAERGARRFRQNPDQGPEILTEDIMGIKPVPDAVPELAELLASLEGMIGLVEVKQAIDGLARTAANNYDRELRSEPPDDVMLHRLFVGNPGTGKTTVARLYGRILKCLGFLSNGDVVYKTASDFIGSHVGESAKNAQAILQLAVGKVLLIDEAYGLNDASSTRSSKRSPEILARIVRLS